jgi:hypothetical protein
MAGQRDRVREQGEAKEIGLLAQVSEAVCPLEVEAVLEGPVQGLGVASPRVEAVEVGIARGGSLSGSRHG